MSAEHEGPVTSVCISPDGQRVLSTTSSGHLGFLDIPSREYSMLVRSHTAPVLALATEGSRRQLATVSQDHTVRVWDLATLQQVGCSQKGGIAEGGTEGQWVGPRQAWSTGGSVGPPGEMGSQALEASW